MKPTLNANWNPGSKIFPAYERFPNQAMPCAAYLILDIATGDLDLWIRKDSGIPADIWNGYVERYPINPMLDAGAILVLIDDCRPYLERVLAGSGIRDTINHVIDFDDDALDARHSIDALTLNRNQTENVITDPIMQLLDVPDTTPNLDATDLADRILAQHPAEYLLLDKWLNRDNLIAEIERFLEDQAEDDERAL